MENQYIIFYFIGEKPNKEIVFVKSLSKNRVTLTAKYNEAFTFPLEDMRKNKLLVSKLEKVPFSELWATAFQEKYLHNPI